MKKNEFHGRGLTSLAVVTSFLIMTVTGIVLYFTPHGRVAYWVKWELIGLTRTEWNNIHIISSIVFASAGAFHIYFNWKAIINYLSGKIAGSLKYKREMTMAAVLSVFIIAGSIYLIPPLNYVIDFSEYLKNSWVRSREYEPPFGHAERVTLKTFAKRMEIDPSLAKQRLMKHNIYPEKTETLKNITERHGIKPIDILKILIVEDYSRN